MDNLPDLSLENDIIDKLNLSDDEKNGAIKFLEAFKHFKDIPDEISDSGDDYLPTPINKKLNTKQENSLKKIVGEFLNTYIILGYDLSGNHVEVIHAPTAMSMDAMMTGLYKTTSNYEYLLDDE